MTAVTLLSENSGSKLMSMFHLRTVEKKNDEFILHVQNDQDASVHGLGSHPDFTIEDHARHAFWTWEQTCFPKIASFVGSTCGCKDATVPEASCCEMSTTRRKNSRPTVQDDLDFFVRTAALEPESGTRHWRTLVRNALHRCATRFPPRLLLQR